MHSGCQNWPFPALAGQATDIASFSDKRPARRHDSGTGLGLVLSERRQDVAQQRDVPHRTAADPGIPFSATTPHAEERGDASDPSAPMSLKRLQTVVGFRSETGVEISDQRIRLLEAIDTLGSISAAARTVGLTYRGAWDAVAALNAFAEHPLVQGHAGGRAGGGAALTEEGRQFLRAVQTIRRELQRVAHTVSVDLGAEFVVPALSWRHMMRTSARNTLLCKVATVKHGPVNAEVVLDVSEAIRLVAIITEESVKSLELVPGREVFALVKSSFVVLAPAGEVGRTSARNVLPGTVARREDGAVNSEIILDLGEGKSITAIVTRESAANLDFKVGDRAVALIKASHIILAVD